MKIFPAIDIKDKKCVRLIKGDFENKTEYETSPIEQAAKFKDHGFKNLHIVDLDGALTGKIVNLEIIKRNKEHLTFSFDLQIKDLKNFTNLISQIKQSNLRFKIIRHKQKKNAFIRRIFENFKRN